MKELYLFANPLHADYWSIDATIQKLQMNIEEKFAFTPIWTSCEGVNMYEQTPRTMLKEEAELVTPICPAFQPPLALVALKAAQCQSKLAAKKFVTYVQLAHFGEKKNVTDIRALQECAKLAGLDVETFTTDLVCPIVRNALWEDYQLAREFHVSHTTPTIVFFGDNPEEEGIQIPAYDSYAFLAEQMGLTNKLTLPKLADYIKTKVIVSVKTLAEIYQHSEKTITLELKKLLLQQEVAALSHDLWRVL